MSKKSIGPQFFILCFVLGAIGGFYLAFNYFFGLTFIILSLLLISRRKFIYFALLSSFFVGFVYMQVFVLFSKVEPDVGCLRGRVSTVVSQSKGTNRFGFSAFSGERLAIETSQENPHLIDEIEVCFAKSNFKEVDGSYEKLLLARYQSAYLISDPQITIFNESSPVVGLFKIREKIEKILKKIFIGDKGVLAIGLILGGSQDFSNEFKEAMQKSGTSHLVAVSGYNVSIITIGFFLFIRQIFSRKIAIIASIFLLIFFCLITGASASVVRASAMGLLYLLAKAFGRKVAPLHLLAIAGFLMILPNPFTLFDIGFQLSFAATFGLIFALEGVDFSKTKKLYSLLALIFAETAVAQLFTLPLILYYFGQSSFLSLIANALILPAVPFTMGFVALSVVAGLMSFSLGLFLGTAGEILLTFISAIIRYFGSIDLALVRFHLPLYGVIVMYGLIFCLWFFIAKKKNEKSARENI
ncbi:MAG: ComEC family competence protein [candidate division WS2 bacterium ADurb.Bin280]|uniref:ComEC family competence protein n=1 Tax=candidate division WS2 bacterium ADurb.Bin280 TaxID=1852829 RepID=A0A1V5SBJ9_9BACT|nr:MAG: ComEC family competence protein [candidate division WS2 bacterium ADurb.Bin280]